MTRAAVYVRISNDPEGRKLGVGRQEEDCRALADRRGWEVADIYPDNDVTGSGQKRRPAWERLLNDLEAGRVDALLAYSSSRMYRNLRDLSRLIELAQKGRVQIDTVVSGQVNLSTADGIMLANILASVDQGEVDRTRERVNRKRASLVSEGKWTGGRRPFGFDSVQETPHEQAKNARLVVNEPEAQLIRRAASDVLNGVSLATVARRWNDKGVSTTGGKRWSKSHVRAVLGAERNSPAILTETDRRQLLDLFDGRRQGRGAERYLLTGILHCGRCGGGATGRGGRYICRATGPVHLAAPRDRVEATVRDAAAERPDREVQVVHDPSEPLVRQRETVVGKMEALGESDLPDAVIRGRARKLQRELDSLDDQLMATRPRGQFARLLEEAEQWDERAWIEGLVERVVLLPARPGANRFDPARVEITWR